MAVSKSIATLPAFQPDERQREAIEHVHGPVLVVAGAGTGKTTVLTQRIAWLIREGHARPDEILAVTYTDNAAKEMRERVRAEVRATNVRELQATTFHAYCNELLKRNGREFGVLDDKDLWIYLRRRLHELRLEHFVRAAKVSQFLEDLLDFMRRCHDELVSPEQYAGYVRRVGCGELPVPRVAKSKDALPEEEVLGRCREIARVFAFVEDALRQENLGTFGHMITRAHELLQRDAGLLAHERQRARFILIDEFQDANFAQVKILQKLAGEEKNVFAVGDPDQAIYRFRGASSAAFGLFQRNFPEARLVVLEKNRRSRTPILKSAFALIEQNRAVDLGSLASDLAYKRSPLISARDEEAGGQPAAPPVEAALFDAKAKENESSDVVAAIQQRRRQLRCKWSDFAVLYRIHGHREQLAAELAEQEIPFSIENLDVLDTGEARDLLACAGAAVADDDGASLLRVASFPQFEVSPEELRSQIRALPKDATGAGVYLVLGKIEGGPAVLDAVRQAREEIAASRAKAKGALEILLRRLKLDPSSAPRAALLEFAAAWEKKPITKRGELSEFLEYLDFFREARGVISLPAREDDAVQLMTAHGAKGLEWGHVFILRANSGSFPIQYKEPLVEFPSDLRDPDSLAQAEGKDLHQAEERRLFYVAMTRARDSLTIYAKRGTGKADPTPSGFLRDLLKDASLRPWLRERPARAFQTDLFGEAGAAIAESRMGQWLALPPVMDLSEKLSASAIQTYETCPLQFKLEREWRIPSEAAGAMQYGGAIHSVLRTFGDAVRFQREISDQELTEVFRAALASARIQDRYQHELYEKQGVQQLQGFLEAWRRRPPLEVLHTEEWFEIRVGTIRITGRIDRMDRLSDGSVAVVDYKTGRPRSQEDADESLQLSIYAIAAREKWGYEPERLVFYNLEGNAPVITSRSNLQLQQAKCKVEEVGQKIAAANFQAKPGFYCSFCSYRNVCPATEKRSYTNSPAEKALQKT